ncbi:MAG TPA: sulfite exporter TauE/SafE family protein [Myxococcota bacterium]
MDSSVDLDVVDGRFAVLLVAVTVAALLYSTSGHGGGTAYLALFGLFGIAPAAMRPLALVLNVVVAGIGAARLIRANVMPWRTLGFLLLGSMPGSFVGGLVQLPATAYRAVLGVLLVLAAARLFLPASSSGQQRTAPGIVLVVVGLVLGVLSGLTGIGGGIFLSPILVLFRLEDPKRTAAAASAFILVNSISGLVAQATHGALSQLPSTLPLLLVVVGVGGLFGSWLVARRLSPRGLRTALGVVLTVSGLRLLYEAIA